MITPGMAQFQLSYQISPIVLTHGLAGNIPGGQLSILSLTQGNIFETVLSGGQGLTLDDFFAQFVPLPGATLIDNQVATYPFANQQTAANAIITQPLRISLSMVCPVRPPNTFGSKYAILTGLQQSLALHNISGGTYTVATPSYVYTECILLRMEDISNGQTHQPQITWRLDFEQPLVTLAAAGAAQNTLMNKITSGTQLSGTPAWSGPAAGIGNPASGLGTSVVPATQPLAGASVDGTSSLQPQLAQ